MNESKGSVITDRTLVVLAGIAGAGKSSTKMFFEDNGFYAIGTLPAALVPPMVSLLLQEEGKDQIAIQVDVASVEEETEVLQTLADAREQGWRVETVFLDCATPVVVKRYSETRRPHPRFDIGCDKTIMGAIEKERAATLRLKESANLIIDTTALTIHDLKRTVRSYVESLASFAAHRMRVNFQSFGFKRGVPIDCDLVADVRFLPNPHFDPELRPSTGLDEGVKAFVFSHDSTREFIEKYTDLLSFLIPHYMHEGKAYLNIGIGCTGGKHRSVAIAEELATRISFDELCISVVHRDAAFWAPEKKG